jgi:putative transposase
MGFTYHIVLEVEREIFYQKTFGRALNHGRPHLSLGPGIPQPPPLLPVTLQAHRHRLPPYQRVVARAVLGGLHHQYELIEQVA